MLVEPSRRLLTSVPVSTTPHSSRSSTSYSWLARRLRQMSLMTSPPDFSLRAMGCAPVPLHSTIARRRGEQELTGSELVALLDLGDEPLELRPAPQRREVAVLAQARRVLQPGIDGLPQHREALVKIGRAVLLLLSGHRPLLHL